MKRYNISTIHGVNLIQQRTHDTNIHINKQCGDFTQEQNVGLT